jgi:hypothetical protein
MVCPEEINRIPDGIPGVYVLQAFLERAGLYLPVYAGKAADLRQRLRQHAETRSTAADMLIVRARLRPYFSAAPVMQRLQRDGVESALIRLLRPPCNRQVPRCDPLFPNLPLSTLRLEEEP